MAAKRKHSLYVAKTTPGDKFIYAQIGALDIRIDFDDVDHAAVKRDLKRLREVIDAGWRWGTEETDQAEQQEESSDG